MAPDDDDFEDDLYDDEFDFVDDEDDDLDDDDSDFDSAVDEADSAIEEELPSPREPVAKRPNARQRRFDEQDDSRDEPRDRDTRDHGARDHGARGHEARERDNRDEAPRDLDRADDVPVEEELVEEYKQPEVPANYRVHIYEYGEFKRTIDRPFTAEDAEAFASEYNRTSKSYSRFAITGKEDVKPKKLLEDAKSSS